MLLLEDDIALLRMLTEYLREEGYFVLATNDSEQALQIFDEKIWDLVITDGVLETCSGEEFAALVAARRPEISQILITGSIRAVTDPNLFFGVLHKPFRRNEFLRFVAEALDHAPKPH